MTEQQKVQQFDEKILQYEGERIYGVGGVNPIWVVLQVCTGLIILLPVALTAESRYLWIAVQGVLLGMTGHFRMWRLIVLVVDGVQIPWAEYLKYVPVDWREYRRHRYMILFRYTGKMFLCFVVLRLASQWLGGSLMKEGYQWESVIYAALMCIAFILIPGVLRIWKWCRCE